MGPLWVVSIEGLLTSNSVDEQHWRILRFKSRIDVCSLHDGPRKHTLGEQVIVRHYDLINSARL